MPVDIMSCSLPLCCVMGSCGAYEVFHWQSVFHERHKNRLPNGVHDDKQWTYPNKTESDMKKDRLKLEEHLNGQDNLSKGSYCVWDPVIGDVQGT